MDNSTSPAHRVITVPVPGIVGDDVSVPRILADRLRAVVHAGYDVIRLDVSELTHCDSMTLAAIVQTYVSVVKTGGELKLVHVGKRFRELLAVTKLDRVIAIVEADDDPSGEYLDPDATRLRRA